MDDNYKNNVSVNNGSNFFMFDRKKVLKRVNSNEKILEN